MSEETEQQQPGAEVEETTDPAVTGEADAVSSPDGDTGETALEAGTQGESGAEPFDAKRAAAKIRKANSEAENLRKRLKELEPKAAELQRIKDAEKTESERLAGQLATANEQITKTRQRLVKSQVQALAGNTFADPEDAVGALDLDSYIDSDGDIDEAAIRADLDALLERKPHWAKPQPQPQEGPRRPAPDRTQASGANKTKAPDPAEEFAGWLSSQLKK
ncbi:hypothetical protein [Streptomyces qinglanensis]|uniref:Scaffolding protein n=1 Tax=Streptomyces qinglanensis TaxID=943816 RepID=A0A1H9U2C6_9ACTN|nr:hypothetical protein [Streptomyces qinglanensis]SES03398.1 hypothetical protein SAMN05421870_107231 [Streptomyces qinglanensis]